MTREHLLGYLLGALDEDERQQVARDLADDPGLQFDLRRLENRIEVLGPADDHYEPPLGLALRTCQHVTARAVCAQPTPREAGMRWGVSLVDFVVAAGVVAAAALLFFPAILNSRYQSELAHCQNNLRQFAVALSHYAENSNGFFPQVPTQGNRAVAGIYAPMLFDQGYFDEPRAVVCPSSLLSQARFQLPALKEIDDAQGEELSRLQALAGGSYGFNLGHLENGDHSATRHEGRSNFAIMSDAPSEHLNGRMSANHGGCGQNVLFDDLHVDYLIECKARNCGDVFFLNRIGIVAAGIDRNDAVIGSSSAAPNVHLISRGK
jgi:hypothetical protein